jgi:hypothetical protein
MIIVRMAVCGGLGLACLSAYGDSIPPLDQVPQGVNPDEKAKLAQQKAVLETELTAFQAAAATFNAESTQNQTDQEYDALQARRSQYIGEAKSFNQEVDSSIVDARQVPSGLPHALDSAIAGAYSDAPPGVSDRVRKGFQAVMQQDWTVAKAWFQDALNHDPGNLGLQRLVVFTEYTRGDLRPSGSPPAGAETKEPVAVSNPQADAITDSAENESLKTDLNNFYENYLPQHHELSLPGSSGDPGLKAADVNPARGEDNSSALQKMIRLFTPPKSPHRPTGVSGIRG